MNFLAKAVRYMLPMAALLLVSQSTLACSPMPGARPSTVFDKTQAATLVFEGTVAEVQGGSVMVTVKQYIKGAGAKTVSVKGFNLTSCDDFLNVGDSRLFYANYIGKSLLLKAVYDGAFGSTNSVDSLNIRQATESALTTTVDKQLDISIPKAKWQSPNGALDIWVNLKYIGLENGSHTWRLKDYGQQ